MPSSQVCRKVCVRKELVAIITMRALKLCALFFVAVACQTNRTECQKCSEPGGDCSKAYHGEPGVHCGDLQGSPFCCPSPTTGAKCWACKNEYRCYTGSRPSPNICANSGGTLGVNPTPHGEDGGASPMVTLFILVVAGFAISIAVGACMRSRRQMPLHAQGAAPGISMQQMPVQAKPGQ